MLPLQQKLGRCGRDWISWKVYAICPSAAWMVYTQSKHCTDFVWDILHCSTFQVSKQRQLYNMHLQFCLVLVIWTQNVNLKFTFKFFFCPPFHTPIVPLLNNRSGKWWRKGSHFLWPHLPETGSLIGDVPAVLTRPVLLWKNCLDVGSWKEKLESPVDSLCGRCATESLG